MKYPQDETNEVVNLNILEFVDWFYEQNNEITETRYPIKKHRKW